MGKVIIQNETIIDPISLIVMYKSILGISGIDK